MPFRAALGTGKTKRNLSTLASPVFFTAASPGNLRIFLTALSPVREAYQAYSHDQPDNAMRVARLGVARLIPRGRYRAARVVRELKTLLEAFMGQGPGIVRSVFIVSREGGGLEQVTDGKNSTGYDPTWSPDGNSLAIGGLSEEDRELAVHVLNLATHELSALPGSAGLYSPRWSPDGRYIAALSSDSTRLLIFNLKSRIWTELGKASFGYPTWSRDSRYIYFDTFGTDAAFFRVRVDNRNVERIIGLEDFPRALGSFGAWTGLAPDGSPLIQRDASLDEIYALDWDAP
jgi:WD40-like Beta Propeller Repeat